MEPRGCLAHYDRDEDRYTIRCTVQSVHQIRAALAGQIFRVPHHQLRVVCDTMGGGFGMKGGCYPEYGLSLWASEVVGRPVRWIAERSEGLQSDEQARGSVVEAELALGAGRQVPRAAHALGVVDRRLLFDRPADHPADDRHGVPCQHLHFRGGARRGHRGADQHDDDGALSRRQPARTDLRYREHHREGGARNWASTPPNCAAATRSRRARCPTTTPMRQTYDSGDFAKNLGMRWTWRPTTASRSGGQSARRRGKLLGIGVATTVAATGGRDYEHAEIRFDPAGGVVLLTGSMDHGQGHAHDLQAGAVGQARHRRRQDPLPLGRQRSRDDGDRHVRLALGAARRLGDRRRRRPADRKGPPHRGAYDGGGGRRHRCSSAAGSRSPAPTARYRSMRSRARRSSRRNCPDDIEVGFTERSNFGPAERRDVSVRRACLRGRDRRRDRRGRADPLLCRRRCRDDAEPAPVRGTDPRRHRPGARPGIARKPGLRPGDRAAADAARSWITRCRGPTISAASNCARMRRPTDQNPLGVKGVGEAGTIGAIPAVMNAINDALASVGAPANRDAGDAREGVARTARAREPALCLRTAPRRHCH